MKIKVLVSCGSIYGAMREGETIEMIDEAAKEYIRIGYAESAEAADVEVSTPAPAKVKKTMTKLKAQTPEDSAPEAK